MHTSMSTQPRDFICLSSSIEKSILVRVHYNRYMYRIWGKRLNVHTPSSLKTYFALTSKEII